MQPKRDPNDRRYWPLRQGGIGQGFAKRDRKTHPHRYRDIANLPERSMDAPGKGMPAEGIRTRARLILERALDRLDDKLGEAGVKELNGAIAALGRIAGVQSTDVNIMGSVAHLHLDALRAPRTVAKLNSDNVLDGAKIPYTVHNVNTVPSLDSGADATCGPDAT
jgi:hypothetical protein